MSAGMIKRPWLWTVFAVTLLTIPAAATLVARAHRRQLPSYGAVPTFNLTDQDGAPFQSRALEGKVWVADFVFTSCSEACPRLTEAMAQLQRYLTNRGADARTRLVSFSVDPDRDTPARLKAYATGFLANPALWTFLTGPAQDIQDAVVKGFKQGLEKEKSTENADGFTILHGTKLVLVDGKGQIRGFYDATDGVSMARLREDLAELLEHGGV